MFCHSSRLWLPGAKPRILPAIEKFVWPGTLAALLSFALLPVHPLWGESWQRSCFFQFAVLHGIRWYFYEQLATLKIPILAILYVGYFWLALGFLLLALSFMGWLAASPAWHVFGIGAAKFIFGMMTRALGHTGRPIKAVAFIDSLSDAEPRDVVLVCYPLGYC
ncbi:MAG: NnrS family protein [Turneriella sp.]